VGNGNRERTFSFPVRSAVTVHHDGGWVLRWSGSCCVCCGRMRLLLRPECCSGSSEALKEVVSCTGSQVQAPMPLHKVKESYPVGRKRG